MANMVKFWKGLEAKYTALATKDAATLYFITDTQKLYLGTTLIADATMDDIAKLDASFENVGELVKVSLTEVDGIITALTVDDSALDAKFGDYQPKGDYQPAGDYEATGTAAGLIAELDAEKSSAAVEAGKGIQVTVKEVDGKIDAVTVTGNYDNAYDAKGAAAAVLGAEGDADTAMTVYGVKAYIDKEIDGITTGAGYATTDYVDEEIEGLEFDLSEDGKTLKLINKAGTEVATLDTTDFVVDGMLTSVVADQANNKLTFTWNTVSGIQETVIELSSIADIYKGSTNADEVNVVVSNTNEISATIGANVKTKIDNGNTAHGWGNHADAGYLKATDISGKEDKANLKALAYKDTVATADIDNDAVTADKLADTVNEDIAKGVAAKAVTDTIGDYVKKTDATGYDDIWTETEHNAFVTANQDVLNSGINATKVAGYEATKATVDANKTTWDKADTAVQPEDIANSITVGAESGGEANYQDTTITAGGIVFASHENGANENSLTIVNPVPQGSGEHYTLNVPYENGTLATTDDVKAVQGNTTATIANVVEAVNKLADGQATTDGALRDANSNINELLTALTWIEG